MAEVPVTYDNASLWSNLTSWTAQQLRDAVSVSKYAESLFQRLGYFIPVDHLGQRIATPEPSSLNMLGQIATTTSTSTTTAEALAETIRSVASSAASSVAAQVLSPEGNHDGPQKVAPDTGKGLGSFFSYMTSKWALSCILMALALNRTHIFAATRRRLRLKWHTRLALRIVPIVLLALYARRILRSIQCQTAPDFSKLRWGDPSMKSELMFANPNVFFNHISSVLLMGATDQESCEAVYMVPVDGDSSGLYGSLSILWPLYGVFCLSQFVETVSCSVQGRPAGSETGMTLFEISLAFAEADSALGNQLGWGFFSSSSSSTSDQASGHAIAITRSMILKRVNTPVEVLVVALLCVMSHLTSHFLGVLHMQTKLRLAQTSFWALMFLSCILTSFYNFNMEDPASQGLLRFPTVCLIGHIPHLIVFVGIILCFVIYAVALVLAVTNPAPRDGEDANIPILEGSGFWGRLAEAHGNMQANLSLGDARISSGTDFYTALLRAGMAVISMASEAVYLQEDSRVNLKQHTWLEDERYKELDSLREGWDTWGVADPLAEMYGTIGLIPVARHQAGFTNGYTRERANQSIARGRIGDRKPKSGVGAAERSTRWVLAVEYFCRAINLALRIQSKIILFLMAFCRIQWKPRLLVSLSQSPKSAAQKLEEEKRKANGEGGKRPEWEVVNNGKMYVPRRGDVDVEEWVRKNMRLRHNGGLAATPPSDQEVDTQLYRWWLDGGFWGTEDRSGEYQPGSEQMDDDDDATSVISSTTDGRDDNNSDGGWESLDEDELSGGQRTPTQGSFDRVVFGGGSSNHKSREETPTLDSPMPMSDLARLLNPSSPEEREEARTLAAHLQSERIVTRSRYAKMVLSQRSRVLFPRGPGFANGRDKRWSPEEEAAVLEQILLSRRAAAAEKRSGRDGVVGSRMTMMTGDDDVLVGEALLAANASYATAKRPSVSAEMEMNNRNNKRGAGDWATGAAGLGENGPQCVVCHSEPRTIIVWPCRCLSLCDECRVNLAMNNYGNCVCCRREVISFSRIYVP